MEVGLLGPFRVTDGDRLLELGGHRQKAVLAALALNLNRVVSLDRLIDELWGEEPPAQATGTLQAYVSNLRRILEPGRPPRRPPEVLVTQRPGYVLRLPPEALDIVRFERGAAEGRERIAAGRLAEGRRRLVEALDLWRGPALADFAFERFAEVEAGRLEELRLAVLEDRLRADLDLGAHAAAVVELEALAAAHPTRERLTGLLMIGLYRCGRQADALAAYQRTRRSLVEELGIDPGPELRRLEADILDQVESLHWQAPAAEEIAIDPGPAAPPERAAVARRPLAGRRTELARLEAALERAQRGRGGAVLVAGEPGIGKTRLVEELLARARAAGVLHAWGGAVEGGVTPAYWPWVDVVRALLPEVSADDLRATLGAGLPELAQVVPEVKEVVGGLEAPAALDPETARIRLFESVTALLRTATRRSGALVVVLDDLQWADAASLQLLGFLAPRLRESGLLVLGTYRSNEVGPDHPLGETMAVLARHQAAERVDLTGLAETEVAELIEWTVGQLPAPEVAATVRDRTEGNPFFVTELAQLLASEHELAPGTDRVVPAGVRDVVRRRLARLPEPTTALLALAAVAGRDFELRVLERAADLDADRALELVEAALMSGLVLEDPHEVGWFRFSHDLTRETILGGLTATRRARLHARVGAALVEVYGRDRERAVELAHHFFHAAPVGGVVEAVELAQLAAEVAAGRLAYEQAEEQLARARELAGRLPPGAERDQTELSVLTQLNSLLMATKGYAAPEAGEVLERARELVLGLGETRQAVPVLWGLMAFNFVAGRYREARRHADKLLEVATRSGRPGDLVAARHAVGGTATHQGELEVAIGHLERALATPEGLQDPWIKSWLLPHPTVACTTFLSFALWCRGETDRARQLTADTEVMARTLGHDLSYAHALDFVVFIAALDRDFDLVRRAGQDAVDFAAEKRFPLYVALNTALAGYGEAMTGDPEAGIVRIEEGLAGLRRTGAGMLRTFILAHLAEVHQVMGQPERALDYLAEAIALIPVTGEGFWEAELHRLRGEFLAAGGHLGDAVEAVRTALAVAGRQSAGALIRRAQASLRALGETG